MNTPSFKENLDNKFISQTVRSTIFVSLLVVLSTIIILRWWTKRRQQHHGTNLLLCGISKSGKTLLFNQLTLNANKQTSNSTKINHGIMTLDYLCTDRPIKEVHVIDLPGNLRQRQYTFQAYKTSIKGIIFVIDSTTIEKKD